MEITPLIILEFPLVLVIRVLISHVIVKGLCKGHDVRQEEISSGVEHEVFWFDGAMPKSAWVDKVKLTDWDEDLEDEPLLLVLVQGWDLLDSVVESGLEELSEEYDGGFLDILRFWVDLD